MQTKTRLASAIAALATIAVSILVVALALEGVLRLVDRVASESAEPKAQVRKGKTRQPDITVEDPLLVWSFRPNTTGRYNWSSTPTRVATNSLGIRSPLLSEQMDADIRILVLGDSYGFGWCLDESNCFPRMLESILREEYPDLSLAVLNACVPGYGLYQQRVMLEKILERIDIDVVITTYSLANDPLDDLRVLRYAPDRLLEYSPELDEHGPLVEWLTEHSRLAGLIRDRTSAIRFKLANASSEAIAASELCMRELFETCAQHGIRVAQLQIPHRWQVKGRPGASLLNASSSGAREMRERVASEYGVLSVNAAPPLKRVERTTGMAFIADDPHWTRLGQQAVARELAEALPRDWLRPDNP